MRRHRALIAAGVLALGVALSPEEALAGCGVVGRGPHVGYRPGWHPRPAVASWRPSYPAYRYRPPVWYAPRPVAYRPAGALHRLIRRFSAACTAVYQPRPFVPTYATYRRPPADPRYASAAAFPRPLVRTTPTPSIDQTPPERTPRYVTCQTCSGTGRTACTRCRGTGRVTILGDWGPIDRACPTCGGTGRSAQVCPRCAGSGRVLSQ